MRTHRISIAAIVLISILGVGIGCKRSAEARAQEATTLVRSMHEEFLDARKKVIAKFKANPEADEMRMTLGFDNLAVSEKAMGEEEEVREKALIAFQKDAKEEALIGELRLYAKKTAKGYQENAAEVEGLLVKRKKEIASGSYTIESRTFPMDDKEKKSWTNQVKLFEFQIEYLKEAQRIATQYEIKLAKLLS